MYNTYTRVLRVVEYCYSYSGCCDPSINTLLILFGIMSSLLSRNIYKISNNKNLELYYYHVVFVWILFLTITKTKTPILFSVMYTQIHLQKNDDIVIIKYIFIHKY